MRAESREIFLATVFRCSTPLPTPLCKSGCASWNAARAALLSPLAIAASTFLTELRIRETRARLTALRRSVWRARFFADLMFAMAALALGRLGGGTLYRGRLGASTPGARR